MPMAYHSFGWKASLFGDVHIRVPEELRFCTRGSSSRTAWTGRRCFSVQTPMIRAPQRCRQGLDGEQMPGPPAGQAQARRPGDQTADEQQVDLEVQAEVSALRAMAPAGRYGYDCRSPQAHPVAGPVEGRPRSAPGQVPRRLFGLSHADAVRASGGPRRRGDRRIRASEPTSTSTPPPLVSARQRDPRQADDRPARQPPDGLEPGPR